MLMIDIVDFKINWPVKYINVNEKYASNKAWLRNQISINLMSFCKARITYKSTHALKNNNKPTYGVYFLWNEFVKTKEKAK